MPKQHPWHTFLWPNPRGPCSNSIVFTRQSFGSDWALRPRSRTPRTSTRRPKQGRPHTGIDVTIMDRPAHTERPRRPVSNSVKTTQCMIFRLRVLSKNEKQSPRPYHSTVAPVVPLDKSPLSVQAQFAPTFRKRWTSWPLLPGSLSPEVLRGGAGSLRSTRVRTSQIPTASTRWGSGLPRQSTTAQSRKLLAP